MINKQDEIRDYLKNQMSEAQRKAFEQEIQTNPELAKEVAFNKELMDYIKSHNPELEIQLKKLGEKYATQSQTAQPAFRRSRWSIVALIALVLIAILWYFNQNPEEIKTPENQIDDSSRTDRDTTQRKLQDTAKTWRMKMNDTTSRNTNMDNQSTIIKDKPIAIIDNSAFKPNPYIENLITDGIRSNDVQITINEPPKGLIFKQNQGTATIKIEVNCNKDIPLEIKVFGNIQQDFINNKIILKADFERKNKTADNKFESIFYANMLIEKGIYYYFIYDKKANTLLKVSNFYVK